MRPKHYANHHVQPTQQGRTLSAALREFLPDRSWSQIKKLISQRQIQVNGNLCLEEGRKVKPGDVIQVWEHPLPPPVDEQSVRVRYADQHLVIVEKPAGITTLRHAEERNWSADRKRRQPTLDELVPRALAKHLGWKLEDTRPQPKRLPPKRGRKEHRHLYQSEQVKLPQVRAVHRLDRDTSGLMVFARTQQAETALIRLFSRHRIQRAYLAVAHGKVPSATIETMLVRDRGDGLRGSVIDSEPPAEVVEGNEPQQAITHVKPLEQIGNYSLIECRLETGRTHQIRIHLAERGHMLCGEKTYTHALGGRPQADPSGAPRQALHAAELGFVHPQSGETILVKSSLPPDLQQWLVRLRKQASTPSESPTHET
ncbi:Ribosomal large subunit pseudouridine synthase D [Anatilimnocola aggregata]|uniref:Ribosomal large subunit pseudouridine synthase D n=1 Tax=Anatilimnocola aggregata TaxID=2528021 RepID=A0A517YBH9_9BACT|nr:pseudouridine synthase [Anatilimnocola aggregata]QDU27597.1 Ribosomal large subunit pseudouridine synthase D [Anatilimnocola aggregata]